MNLPTLAAGTSMRWIAVAALAVLATCASREVAEACSCMGPADARLISPLRTDEAPLNAHVRVALSLPEPSDPRVLELRSSRGELVPMTATRSAVEHSQEAIVDLVPSAPLRPHERYQVSARFAQRWPDTLVLGGFKTGASEDHEAPVLMPLGPAKAPARIKTMSSSCDSGQPWVRWTPEAHDPGRTRAALSFAVWLGDAKGNVDTTRPPTVWLDANPELAVGATSSCSRQSFPFPAAPFAWLAVAAVDEAGNRSVVQKQRVPVVRKP